MKGDLIRFVRFWHDLPDPMTTVIQMIETSGPGGAENIVIRLSVALREQGIRPVVLMLKEGWLADELRKCGIEVNILPVNNTWDIGWIYRAMKLHFEAVPGNDHFPIRSAPHDHR